MSPGSLLTTRRNLANLALLPGLAALAACGSSGSSGGSMGASTRVPGISCAPFARELSGIALYGEADSWWSQAGGKYPRSDRPVTGGVLVFRRTSRLRSGHVSVVTKLVDRRQILVTQANWVPGQLDEDQLVVDVSGGNDWTEVRVWWPPVNQLGVTPYPTHGFIHPPRPATYAQLAKATPVAARYALDTRGRPAPRARYDL
jgi:surface antigen